MVVGSDSLGARVPTTPRPDDDWTTLDAQLEREEDDTVLGMSSSKSRLILAFDSKIKLDVYRANDNLANTEDGSDGLASEGTSGKRQSTATSTVPASKRRGSAPSRNTLLYFPSNTVFSYKCRRSAGPRTVFENSCDKRKDAKLTSLSLSSSIT